MYMQLEVHVSTGIMYYVQLEVPTAIMIVHVHVQLQVPTAIHVHIHVHTSIQSHVFYMYLHTYTCIIRLHISCTKSSRSTHYHNDVIYSHYPLTDLYDI